MADSAQACTRTEGSGGLNLVSTISQFVKNPVGRLVELKWCFCYWWWRFTVSAKDFYLCKICTWQLQSKTRGWGSDNTERRGRRRASWRSLWGRAASSHWRFTSLRKHRRPRSSSWGSPTPAVSDAHPEFLGRCSNVRLWKSFKLEYMF